MPSFGNAVRFNRIPVVGLIFEKTGTPPATPTDGLVWTDTSVIPNITRVYQNGGWKPWLEIGTVAGSAADASTVLLKANNLSDLASAATARGNLGLGNAATATTGTGATNVILGNDSRLTDTRTPTAGSVVDASVAAGAAIAESKLALASDAAAATASRRTLGFAGNSAMPGTARLDQIAAPTAAVNLNSQRLIGVAPSVTGTDAVNRNELDAARQGYAGAKDPVRVATATNTTIATPGASIDGVALATGDRVLLIGQTTALENGVWVWNGSAAAMTRAVDADAVGEIKDGTTIGVGEGSSAGSVYIQTASVNATAPGVGTAETWVQYSTQASYVGTANRVTVTGTTIDISAAYAGQASITTVGTLTSGSLGAGFGTVGVAQGGTGATTAAGARASLGAAQSGYQAVLGALTAGTPLTVTHNLNTDKCIAQVRDATTGEYIGLDVIDAPGTPNTLTVTAGIAYAANALDIVVIPI